MRYAVGYDRDLARQFFLRTFREVGQCGRLSGGKLMPEEVDYVADRFAETAVFGKGEKLGSPWCDGDIEELARATAHTENRLLLQQAEAAANQLLIIEGLVRRGGLHNLYDVAEGRAQATRYQYLASVLYRNASNWYYLREPQRFVLRRMSLNVRPWTQVLALIPGSDYLEALGSRTSSILVIPGEE